MLTEEQINIVDEMTLSGMGAKKIEKATGIPRGQIQHYLIIKNKPEKIVGKNRFKKISAEMLDSIKELRASGLSDKKIAAELGITVGRALHYRRQLENYDPIQYEPGVYRSTYPLTDEQMVEVRKLRECGFSYRSISKQTGVHVARVQRFCESEELKKGTLAIPAVCVCGKAFLKDKVTIKYCSQECSDKYSNGSGTCIICGKEFWKKSFYNQTCSSECRFESHKLTNEQFEERLEKIFGGEIVSLSTYGGWYAEVTVMCKICGKLITRQAATFIHDETGCTDCSVISRGERDVLLWLNANGVEHSRQYTFNDLKIKSPLRYDFGVYKNKKLKALIEFDGRQHFESVDYFGGDKAFEKIKISDKAKNDYAAKKKIKLIRIPYYEKKLIAEILTEELREVGVI